MLVEYAHNYPSVVRLKSGDAGIFGRLEEEIYALTEANIEFEVIPGVPSACAAAAAANIPLTRRLAARRVQFITGSDVTGNLPTDLNFTALTDANAITSIYMGRRTFPKLAKLLIENGLAPDTPAILAESIGSDEERLKWSTVSKLAEFLIDEPKSQPALILYGPLVNST